MRRLKRLLFNRVEWKMEHVVIVPDHHPGSGLQFVWDEGFEIAVSVGVAGVTIKADRAGLISLARHLLSLAQEGVQGGAHMHLTAGQEIESDVDLILELMIRE